jgi:hypothetical protein
MLYALSLYTPPQLFWRYHTHNGCDFQTTNQIDITFVIYLHARFQTQ